VVTLVEGRIGVGALCCGLGQGALDAALAYAHEREAFGRPIGEFGGIREQLADSAIGLAAGRELVFRAARLLDSGEDAADSAARAKLFASEAALRSCDQSIQIHGGYGYTDEIPAHRFWRDARLLTIGEGTSEILRGVIARSVFA
jgi:alkylation response protein AidB-like acyl-CoA dehydrogenase